jgi:hypothetical protein
VLVVLTPLYALDLHERQAVIRLAATDMETAGQRLAAAHILERQACRIDLTADDLDILLEALTSVEALGRGRLQRGIEAFLVRTALRIGLPLPDFSVGPAQIRISTAMAAAQWAASGRRAPRSLANRNSIALDLLSPCGAREWGRLVLAMFASQTKTLIAPLDRAGILRLAALFNGQETVPDDEAAIAHYLYRELVYQVYQVFRFRRQNCRSILARTPSCPRIGD